MNAAYKKTYTARCASERIRPSLFSQPWWLDAVCGTGDWQVAMTFDKAGEPLAAMPYCPSRLWGFPVIKMPQLTPFLEIWMDYPRDTQKRHRHYSFEQNQLQQLISQLPAVAFFSQNYHYRLTNWLPFFWAGFTQRTFYSYVLEDLSDLNQVFANFKSTTRSMIRRAEQELWVHESNDAEMFYRLNRKSFDRQGRNIPYSFSFFQRLDEAAAARQSRRIFLAQDAAGQVQAGLYLVWDSTTAYNLAIGLDYDGATPGAVQLLLWYAIREAATKVNRFDFEGSMLQGVASMFRAFDGEQKPYFNIQRSGNKAFELLNVLRTR